MIIYMCVCALEHDWDINIRTISVTIHRAMEAGPCEDGVGKPEDSDRLIHHHHGLGFGWDDNHPMTIPRWSGSIKPNNQPELWGNAQMVFYAFFSRFADGASSFTTRFDKTLAQKSRKLLVFDSTTDLQMRDF